MMSDKVILEEQGLRDGLQSLPLPLPTQHKLAWIEKLLAAGLQRIQVASFVHPTLVPQMADAEDLFAKLPSRDDVVFSALVLNRKGVERAAAAGAKHLAISLSASDTHSRMNARMGIEEAKTELKANVELAKTAGIAVRAGIQCAFGCRFEGKIDPASVLDLVKHHLDAGADELALADSTGMANPRGLRDLMEKVLDLAGSIPVALHLHNTENKGLANVYAGLEAGVRHFDTAFGGLGGCPFIKRATGNIATEDTIHLLSQMGYETGIDPLKVSIVSKEAQGWLGFELPGVMYRLLNNPEIKNI
jgi:hydroxymethylglutaryl-CoA lyase